MLGKAAVQIWRRVILPLLLVIVLGAAAAALVKIAFFPDSEHTAVQPGAQILDPVIPVERGSVVNELSLSGAIARDANVNRRSELNGTVRAVHVGQGGWVEAGQPLFTVRQDDPVRDIDVLAPERGEITELGVIAGQQVSVGVEVAQISPYRFHLLATVQPVQLYRLVNAPGEGTVTIAGGPAPFSCTGVGVQVTQEGTAQVRCAIPGDQTVFPGLPATLDLAIGQVDDALVIPVTAVQGGAGSGVVWVDAGDGSAPEERQVVLGVGDGVIVEVTEGLAEGEAIRQFVPGFVAPVEEFCYEMQPGVEVCESGMSW